MTGRPTTPQSVADGRALYRADKPPATSVGDTAPSLEQLLDDQVLLGRTRARAARGDQAARAAIAAHDNAWRALDETGGDAA